MLPPHEAPVQIVDADDAILILERTKVLARVGLQRSGAPVQIVDADDPILTLERTKVLMRVRLSNLGRVCKSLLQMIQF